MSTAVTDLIGRARAEWAAELDFAPSASRPPVAYTWDSGLRAMVPDDRPLLINPGTPHEQRIADSATQSTRVGAPLSARLVRLLSRAYGSDMGLHRALPQLEDWCRRRHVKADEPLHAERGYLCPRLVTFVVLTANGAGEHGMEEAWRPELRAAWYRRLVRAAALDEDLDYDEAADFIAAALRQCNEWIDAWRAGAA